jgi:hypothetical protein
LLGELNRAAGSRQSRSPSALFFFLGIWSGAFGA